MPYYITKDGTFVNSYHPMESQNYKEINDVEYAITRLIVRGYTQEDIELATKKVFAILKSLEE